MSRPTDVTPVDVDLAELVARDPAYAALLRAGHKPVAGGAHWPVALGAQDAIATDFSGTATRFASVTCNGTANVKGSYTQLISSTTLASSGIIVHCRGINNSMDFLVDIAVGAAASEQVIIANILVSNPAGGSAQAFFFFPIYIPSGVRLSARAQSSDAGGQGIDVGAYLVEGGFLARDALGIVETWGADTSDSGGAQMDPGGTVDTKGAWTQLTASATHGARWLTLGLGCRNATTPGATQYRVDIGVGAAASEQVIVPDVIVRVGDNGSAFIGPGFNVPVSIPAGARVAARCMCNDNNATNRPLDVVAYAAR